MKNQGIYNSLEAQLNKLARHNRQGSYRTKERYYMGFYANSWGRTNIYYTFF